MKDSIKNKILNFVESGQWFYGGQIEDYIRQVDKHKASNASRRCRELADENKLEVRYVIFEGRKVVQYRLPQNLPQAERKDTGTNEHPPSTQIIKHYGIFRATTNFDYCCGNKMVGKPEHSKDCKTLRVKINENRLF